MIDTMSAYQTRNSTMKLGAWGTIWPFQASEYLQSRRMRILKMLRDASWMTSWDGLLDLGVGIRTEAYRSDEPP
jgi:hypothetical protein